MRLELASFQVEDVEFSSETRLSAKTLYVNENELKEHLLPDPYIEDIRMEVARPGESTRIVHAVDVVEPRDKASGPGRGVSGAARVTDSGGQRHDEQIGGDDSNRDG